MSNPRKRKNGYTEVNPPKKARGLSDVVSIAYTKEDDIQKYNLKAVDVVLDSEPTGVITQFPIILNPVQQATGSWNRVGRKIAMHSLRLKGLVRFGFQQGATDGEWRGNALRCVVVYDRRPPSASTVPAFEDVFGHTVPGGTETTTMLDGIKYDEMGRFILLKEWIMKANPPRDVPTTALQYGEVTQHFDEFVDLDGLQTVFSGTSAVNHDVSTGALYFFTITNTVVDNRCQLIVSNARLAYRD